MDAWETLLTATVTLDMQNQHNAEVARLKEQITQAKADLVAEDNRMAEEQAALNAQAQQIQAQNYRLMLDRTTSEEVLRRKYRSRLPPVYEGLNLFQTPGAGPSNPKAADRAEAPRITLDRPRATELPRRTVNPP